MEEVATPEAFLHDPELVHTFYNARRDALLNDEIKPNVAHLALARLEQHWPGGVLLVTQNVDDLHERAGSQKLIHMHGELLKARCTACDEEMSWHQHMDVQSYCPSCNKRGHLRVNVVWFGEMPMHMDVIYRALRQCGLFISIGTSGHVYPAAGFAQVVSENPDAKTLELNLEPSLNAEQFSRGAYGLASEIVPEFVDGLLSRLGD